MEVVGGVESRTGEEYWQTRVATGPARTIDSAKPAPPYLRSEELREAGVGQAAVRR